MNRKDFISKCGFACVGVFAAGFVLESCGTTRNINAAISDSDMIVPLSNFEVKKNGQTSYSNYVVAYNDLLQYPICVFRHSATEYTALLMQCTHQGAELQVFGDKLQCPAHGSEFDNRGNVTAFPANEALRKFPVTIDNNQLKISLKA